MASSQTSTAVRAALAALTLPTAADMGVADRLFFCGHVTDAKKFQLLQISDVYVSSSRHEGFGIVFLEAMASGLPIACYDNGGQADFLKNNETGFLVPVGNKDLLANRILDLYKNVRLKDETFIHFPGLYHLVGCGFGSFNDRQLNPSS